MGDGAHIRKEVAAEQVSRGLVVAWVLLLCSVQVLHAQARGPSTPAERAKIVALTRLLERDPLGEDAPATRQWLQARTIEVPGIRVYACDDLLGHGLGDNYPYSREISLQVVFAAAAFAIERQDKPRDHIAQYSAGVEGALRVYEVLLKSKSDAKSAFLDGFLAKRDQGELRDYIATLAKEKCKRSNAELIAAPAGAGVGLFLGLLVARGFGGRRVRRVTGLESVKAGNGSARIARISRRIVCVCAAYYVMVGVALHILEALDRPGNAGRVRVDGR